MTAVELQALEDLANAATPGPWRAERIHEGYSNEESEILGPTRFDKGTRCFPIAATARRTVDAEFIAAARDAVPKLIAEVRQLRKKLATETTLTCMWDEP